MIWLGSVVFLYGVVKGDKRLMTWGAVIFAISVVIIAAANHVLAPKGSR